MDEWYNALEPGEGYEISLSENEWTNNKIGLDWLQTIFKPYST